MNDQLLRVILSHPAFTGISRQHFGELIEELAPRWESAREATLAEQRGGARRRACGAGRKPKLVFVDRLLVTLVCLRLGMPHQALADLYAVDRSTVSGAVRQVRPLLAARGFAIPRSPRPAHPHPARPVRLRRGRAHRAVPRRHRSTGQATARGTPRP
ncbi:transposase family protein [Streptomyces sp. NPDC090499]|uniref:helix-turn-helix domain-containing protein n=1 Tax=Streptomyces sp. NPDC090499 TaxID=3365965 RepID=UPI00382AC1A3